MSQAFRKKKREKDFAMVDYENMKVCAYVMTVDSGLAPNPFNGLCTLAVCTPNHVRANLNNGNYIIGIAGVSLCEKLRTPRGQLRLIYAMKVDRILELSQYYDSAEYRLKIPRLSGSRIEMCGDNFYQLKNGILSHTRETNEHTGPIENQDCEGNRVFIGKEFSYFGSAAPEIPQQSNWGEKLTSQLKRRSVNITYIYGGRSKYTWTENDLKEFMRFLDDNKLDYIPAPIDFDGWDCEPEKKPSCSA